MEGARGCAQGRGLHMIDRDDIRRRPLYPTDGYLVDMALGNRTIASNEHARMWIRRVAMYQADELLGKRTDAHKCRTCFYLRSTGQRAGHVWVNCCQCDKAMATDCPSEVEVCLDCAEHYGLCRGCGGDIDGNERRRKLVRATKR
jgi:hypothetical protein